MPLSLLSEVIDRAASHSLMALPSHSQSGRAPLIPKARRATCRDHGSRNTDCRFGSRAHLVFFGPFGVSMPTVGRALIAQHF